MMTDMISRADAIAAILDEGLLRQDLNAPTYADAIRALPAAQVSDPAKIRDAALREALVLVRSYLDAWDDATVNGSSISIICDAIEALIHTHVAASPAPETDTNADSRQPTMAEAMRETAYQNYINEITGNGNSRMDNITICAGPSADIQRHIAAQVDMAFQAGWSAALAKMKGGT